MLPPFNQVKKANHCNQTTYKPNSRSGAGNASSNAMRKRLQSLTAATLILPITLGLSGCFSIMAKGDLGKGTTSQPEPELRAVALAADVVTAPVQILAIGVGLFGWATLDALDELIPDAPANPAAVSTTSAPRPTPTTTASSQSTNTPSPAPQPDPEAQAFWR